MQKTADPREIAILAQNLDKLDPDQHHQEAIQAARDTLAMAASGKLEGYDVAPLFELLQKYGDASLIPELEKDTSHWNYYGTMALAQIPDGAGIPSLIQMAQGTTGARGNAMEMLTQLAPQYPDAMAALLEMAHANKILPNQWPYLTPFLAGDQYQYQDSQFATGTGTKTEDAAHVLFGNQHFTTAPPAGGLTAEQLAQRTALIDQLRSVTSDPAAIQALQQARDLLAKRTIQTAAAP
jgi:hypothetical protein